MNQNGTRVSAVVPTYNSGDLIDRCLDALSTTGMVDDIVVLDGGSSDGTDERAAQAPNVRAVRLDGTHIGHRMNKGLEMARNDFVLLLNDDAFVDPDTPARLVDVMRQHPNVGVAGSRLRYGDGSDQRSAGGYKTLTDMVLSTAGLARIAARLRKSPVQPGPAEGLEQATWMPLCAALIRKSAFQEIGGFDERFTFYSEDQDFARRLNEAGWLMVVRDDAGAIHLGGGATTAKAPGPWFVRYYRNRFVYLQKHYPRAWRLYAVVWAARATLHIGLWRARALVRRLRGDADGAAAARDWADTFKEARRPPAPAASR